MQAWLTRHSTTTLLCWLDSYNKYTVRRGKSASSVMGEKLVYYETQGSPRQCPRYSAVMEGIEALRIFTTALNVQKDQVPIWALLRTFNLNLLSFRRTSFHGAGARSSSQSPAW